MEKKELDVGSIIKRSFLLLKDNPAIIVIWVLPFAILFAAIVHLGILGIVAKVMTGELKAQALPIKATIPFFITLAAYLAAYFVASVAAMAAVILKAKAAKDKRPMPTAQAIKLGLKKFPRLLVAMLAFLGIVAAPPGLILAGLISLFKGAKIGFFQFLALGTAGVLSFIASLIVAIWVG